MSSSLFTKPINEITINDITTFCSEGIEEGVRVEYKRDWPSDNIKLARELASFANTYGGILLIGIDENDRKPICPPRGINVQAGVDEKINSIAFRSINPPIFPEMQICRFKDEPSKAVILIRVYESDDTPHRVDDDTRTYLRVASQKEPVQAPFEQIEWLMNRRKKAIDNSERILFRAHKRFFDKYKRTGAEPQPGQTQAGIGAFSSLLPPQYRISPTRGISILPLYPHQELFSYLDLINIINKSAIYGLPANRLSYRNNISMQDSIIYSADNGEIIHTEINSLGLIYHKEDFSIDENNFFNDKSVIDIDITVGMILSFLSFALNLYSNIGFWGAIKINVMFDQILQKKLSFGHTRQDFPKNEFDNQIIIERKTTVFQLSDNLDANVISIFKEFLWSFGIRPTEETDIQKILERVKSQI